MKGKKEKKFTLSNDDDRRYGNMIKQLLKVFNTVLLGYGDVQDGAINVSDWLMKRSVDRGQNRSSTETRWNTFLTACWSIWKAMCASVFQGRNPDPAGVLVAVMKAVHENKMVHMMKSLQQGRATQQVSNACRNNNPTRSKLASSGCRHHHNQL